MSYQLEVCIDNLESLHLAVTGGATRIELCSSLALGGLTPGWGLMKQAGMRSPVPVYAMIRPRQGDFLYDDDNISSMLDDIEAAARAGLQGIVFGVLTPEGDVDTEIAQQLIQQARRYNLAVTFHRAIDQCRDYKLALEQIIGLGCERILTSGLAGTAEQGIPVLQEMVSLAGYRITIMAGAGINAGNAAKIIAQTGVTEIHLSGKTTRSSKMTYRSDTAKMGQHQLDDFIVPVTDSEAIRVVADALPLKTEQR